MKVTFDQLDFSDSDPKIIRAFYQWVSTYDWTKTKWSVETEEFLNCNRMIFRWCQNELKGFEVVVTSELTSGVYRVCGISPITGACALFMPIEYNARLMLFIDNVLNRYNAETSNQLIMDYSTGGCPIEYTQGADGQNAYAYDTIIDVNDAMSREFLSVMVGIYNRHVREPQTAGTFSRIVAEIIRVIDTEFLNYTLKPSMLAVQCVVATIMKCQRPDDHTLDMFLTDEFKAELFKSVPVNYQSLADSFSFEHISIDFGKLCRDQKMKPKKNLILVIGRSGAGKDTLVRHAQKVFGAAAIPSYTDRPIRPTETEGVEHTFLSKQAFTDLMNREEVFAYTQIGENGYRYCTTVEMLNGIKSDTLFYVIDPAGYNYCSQFANKFNMKVVYVSADWNIRRDRANARNLDNTTWDTRTAQEDAQFNEFESNAPWDGHIVNNGDITDAQNNFVDLVKTLLGKTDEQSI